MGNSSVTAKLASAFQAESKSGRGLLWLSLVGLVLIVVGPWIFDSYLLNILIKTFFFAVVAITVDVLWGYTGYLTFGQSAFFGLGAYAAGLMFTHHGFSTSSAVMALGLAIGVSALVGGLVGWLSFYRGASPFFATVISLTLPIVTTQLVLSGGQWTGSSSGLTGFTTFDFSLEVWYWIAGGFMVVVAGLGWLMVGSDAGRVLASIRDNESRCAYLGINVPAVKIMLLVVTAVVAGVAGFGYGSFSGVVAPELTGFVLGTELIIWVALGGRGTLWGPLIGTILINVATAYLSGSLPFAWQLILGIAFVVVIVLLPRGLVPLLLRPFGLGKHGRSIPTLIKREVSLPSGNSNQPAFVMKGVTKNFGSLQVLQGIDLTADAGDLVGLIGPNGAGKTTLMRCMSDGLERSAGNVRLCGDDIWDSPPEVCVRLGLGRKFQNANIFESLTVVECLRMARTMLDRPSLFRRADTLHLPPYAIDVLGATGLDQRLGAVAKDLSHGQQQALELAMVLALEPRIVLLDEPTAGLTKTERTQIGQVLSSLAHHYKLCCLLVEHDLDFVQEVANRIVVMHQGKIVMQGSFKEVVESDLVKTIYAGSAHASREAA